MVNGLPLAGTPFSSLNALINVAAPASTQAWKERQVEIAQQAFRDAGGVIIAPALRRAIAHIMLGAGGDAFRVGQLPLEAADHRRAHPPGEQRVLSRRPRQCVPNAGRARYPPWGQRSS